MSDVDQLEAIVADLRREVFARFDRMESQIANASTTAAAAQAQILSHIAVCDERQRQIERHQIDKHRWDEERADEFRKFMSESRNDRAQIRETVHTWGQRVVWIIATVNAGLAMLGLAAEKLGLLSAIK